MRRMLVRWVTGLCCLLGAPAVFQSVQFAGQALVPPPAAMDFTLQASDGMVEAVAIPGDQLQQITVLNSSGE
jgi:hypothetical protein